MNVYERQHKSPSSRVYDKNKKRERACVSDKGVLVSTTETRWEGSKTIIIIIIIIIIMVVPETGKVEHSY